MDELDDDIKDFLYQIFISCSKLDDSEKAAEIYIEAVLSALAMLEIEEEDDD